MRLLDVINYGRLDEGLTQEQYDKEFIKASENWDEDKQGRAYNAKDHAEKHRNVGETHAEKRARWAKKKKRADDYAANTDKDALGQMMNAWNFGNIEFGEGSDSVWVAIDAKTRINKNFNRATVEEDAAYVVLSPTIADELTVIGKDQKAATAFFDHFYNVTLTGGMGFSNWFEENYPKLSTFEEFIGLSKEKMKELVTKYQNEVARRDAHRDNKKHTPVYITRKINEAMDHFELVKHKVFKIEIDDQTLNIVRIYDTVVFTQAKKEYLKLKTENVKKIKAEQEAGNRVKGVNQTQVNTMDTVNSDATKENAEATAATEAKIIAEYKLIIDAKVNEEYPAYKETAAAWKQLQRELPLKEPAFDAAYQEAVKKGTPGNYLNIAVKRFNKQIAGQIEKAKEEGSKFYTKIVKNKIITSPKELEKELEKDWDDLNKQIKIDLNGLLGIKLRQEMAPLKLEELEKLKEKIKTLAKGINHTLTENVHLRLRDLI